MTKVDSVPPFPPDFRLFLASQSPRRHTLLRELGIPYEVVPVQAREEEEGAQAEVLAERNALAKVKGAVLPLGAPPGSFLLGTDTMVEVNGRILGKPRSREEAARMLTLLSGRSHRVISGVALMRLPGSERLPVPNRGAPGSVVETYVLVDHAATEVTFLSLGKKSISAYVASREWVGKAGGYAVQGLAALFVSRIEGEYSNVVGLPLCLLARMFREAGFDLLERRWLATPEGGRYNTRTLKAAGPPGTEHREVER